MKHLLKKFGLTSMLCHCKYRLTSAHVLDEVNYNKPQFSLLTACLIDRDLFWATTRTYNNTNLLELKNIIYAEKQQLPPMEGDFFWSIKQLSSQSITINYYVIPTTTIAVLPKDCQVVLPIYSDSLESNELPLTTVHQYQPEILKETINCFNVLNLPGLFIKRNSGKNNPEKLTGRHLLLSLAAIFCLAGVTASAYSVFAINSYQNKKLANEEQVNKVLLQRQQINRHLQSSTDFIAFLKSNPNGLNKLSQLNINLDNVFIERVKLITKGVEVFGTTDSATKLLEQIVQSEPVKEAKFSRSVTKNSNGLDVFTIEVSWK